MACQTCNSNIYRVGRDPEGVPLFWCSSCGTLRANVSMSSDRVPLLVRLIGGALNIRSLKQEAPSAEQVGMDSGGSR
jgi:hypothetical protein